MAETEVDNYKPLRWMTAIRLLPMLHSFINNIGRDVYDEKLVN